jgi:ATP-dependent exoDNAse (exonuclease V) alpha subunit
MSKKVVFSKTIHKLFAEFVSQETEIKMEEIRVVIIDECSMIPLRLFAYFMEMLTVRCPNLQRIYLIGDVAQLESVEAGAVLKDMSDFFPAVFLEECHRVTPASRLIYENALKVRKQDPGITTDDQCFKFSSFTRILYNDMESTIRENPEMNQWNTHFISPYREEARNIGQLAKQFFTGKIHANGVYHKGDKILCTKNYHTFGVINGDFFKICDIQVLYEENRPQEVAVKVGNTSHIGTANNKVIKIKCSVGDTSHRLERGEWFRLMVVPASFTDDDMAEMDTLTPQPIDTKEVPLSAFTLGYCTTNHQFQGCEADYVVFDLRKVTYFVNWKQVYTAITRAKKKVIILGNMENFVSAVTTKVYPRRSMLTERLEAENTFLRDVPKIEHDEEQRLIYLLKEVAVTDSDSSAPTTQDGKRPNESANNSTGGNKTRRY